MRLRDVQVDDVDTYLRIRCDPVMMADLGGPQPRDGIAEMVHRHVRDTKAGTAIICMIVPGHDPREVAGTVALTTNEHDGHALTEIGWAVLPAFQGRGLAKAAVRLLLERAHGTVHAFPATTNAASNAVCRATGFELMGRQEVLFTGKVFRTNHWQVSRS